MTLLLLLLLGKSRPQRSFVGLVDLKFRVIHSQINWRSGFLVFDVVLRLCGFRVECIGGISVLEEVLLYRLIESLSSSPLPMRFKGIIPLQTFYICLSSMRTDAFVSIETINHNSSLFIKPLSRFLAVASE